MHDDTLGVHAGRDVDPATGAVVPPLYLSTTYERDPDGEFSRGYNYVREGNPNRDSLERCLRELEGGAEAIALPSGMAACYAIAQALSPGDRVVASHGLYFGFQDLLSDHFARWGLQSEFVDASDLDALKNALGKPTRAVIIETPTNPLMEIVDIAACAALAHGAGAMLVCDNTFATPVLQRPLELGADAVVHSLTKYLGGHSDVMGGAVVTKERGELASCVRYFQHVAGAVIAPFDAWMTLRGIATLPMRMRAHSKNAMELARFLESHPKVVRVHYPGLESHPGHAIARRQMTDFGGMLSFEIVGGRAEAFAVTGRLQLVVRATSLGGVHSLIEHRASIEGPRSRAPESLLRLSTGIEDARDIIADLKQALDA